MWSLHVNSPEGEASVHHCTLVPHTPVKFTVDSNFRPTLFSTGGVNASAGVLFYFRFARRALGIAFYTTRKESKRRGKRSAGYDAKKFLNDIKTDLGSDKFSDFLALKGEVTLIFALDGTGSMRDEIKASKEMIKKISRYDRGEPVDYMLTTFSDPIGRFIFCLLRCFSHFRES